MSYDPRIIAVALEDLLQEMRRWSARASETLSIATYSQRQAKEIAERALHRASVLLDEAQQDEERVTKVASAAAAILTECQTAKENAHHTLQQAEEALYAATSTLEFWQEELRKALAWLARAEARLARAISEYESARRAYEHAQSNLARANARYSSCINDKNRSNCNSEASDVRSAQGELQDAVHRLQLAEAEVIAARAEVAAARARVQCCSNAVHYATEAVNVAQESESLAQQAVNSAERGFEFAQAAESGALAAKVKVAEELEAAEKMLTETRAVVSLTDEAAVHLATADNAEEAAQRYARGAGHELDHRLQLLYQLNLPNLHSTVAGSGGTGGAFVGTEPAGTQPAAWVDEGICFVNVEDLPDPEGISGRADFRKITESEMRSGIGKLQEMRALIESGTGANSDYWADYDKQRGLDFASGYQRVYEAFYGPTCIKVNKDRNSYNIVNGQHRIWLAKQMGITQLPIRVVQRKRHEQ